ncbi:MAG: hypothetical protein JEZ03_09655 [Bacteroidales bacterium]|nr:hypothetical protein [Bacteroidales bacterium]
MIMSFQGNGDLCCSGVYSKDKFFQGIDKVAFVILNTEDLTIKSKHHTTFTTEQLIGFFSEKPKKAAKIKKKLAKGKSISIADFRLVDFVTHSNNETTLIAEPFNQQTYSYISNDKTTDDITKTKTEFVAGDIYFIHFDQDGNILWVKEIDKYQKGSFVEAFSFAHTFHNDKIYLLYNDVKTRELKSCIVDQKGNITQKVESKIKKDSKLGKYFLIPNSSIPSTNGEMIGLASYMFKSRLLKFKFN